MTDNATKALESAAFHAWVTFGDMLGGHKITRAEMQNAYDVLGTALTDFRRAASGEAS